MITSRFPFSTLWSFPLGRDILGPGSADVGPGPKSEAHDEQAGAGRTRAPAPRELGSVHVRETERHRDQDAVEHVEPIQRTQARTRRGRHRPHTWISIATMATPDGNAKRPTRRCASGIASPSPHSPTRPVATSATHTQCEWNQRIEVMDVPRHAGGRETWFETRDLRSETRQSDVSGLGSRVSVSQISSLLPSLSCENSLSTVSPMEVRGSAASMGRLTSSPGDAWRASRSGGGPRETTLGAGEARPDHRSVTRPRRGPVPCVREVRRLHLAVRDL